MYDDHQRLGRANTCSPTASAGSNLTMAAGDVPIPPFQRISVIAVQHRGKGATVVSVQTMTATTILRMPPLAGGTTSQSFE